jgi:multimeric flavodoxin WrbA
MAQNWLVLDALGSGEVGKETLRTVLKQTVAQAGYEVAFVDVTTLDIAPCRGCFGCWTQTPGVCRIPDAGRELAARIVASSRLILLTPVVFGGYAASLKIPMERGVLPTLLPFFQTISGRTRHFARYASPPDLVGIGWARQADVEAETLFAECVRANAANKLSRRHAAVVVRQTMSEGEIRAAVHGVLTMGEGAGTEAQRKILVLNGSPKKVGSNSAVFGDYLEKCLRESGVAVETVSLMDAYRKPDRFEALAESWDAADGAVLVFPLYADQLPGHVMAVLEKIAARRQEIAPEKRQVFAAVSQCGFPEAENNAPALDMCRIFAREAGFAWLGGCAVGGGGMYEGKSLEKLGWLGRKARNALDAQAAMLASRERDACIRENVQVPCPVPNGLYLAVASRGWKRELSGKGKKIDGYARPYAPERKAGE